MSAADQIVCPWCSTEIVWDPEIGPENECPHCMNELGPYRSVKLNLADSEEVSGESKQSSGGFSEQDRFAAELTGQEEWDDGSLDEDLLNEDFLSGQDDYDYEQQVNIYLEQQEETPECSSCHALMLHIGEQTPGRDYIPVRTAHLGAPLLDKPPRVNLFVCPFCFRTEFTLMGEDRVRMVEALRRRSSIE